jgi:hypothetical protein
MLYMKKLIVAAFLVSGMTSFAQEKNKTERRQHRTEMEKITPEQRNELMLKKKNIRIKSISQTTKSNEKYHSRDKR